MEILGDYKVSVIRAFREIEPDFEKLDGLIIAGSHEPKETEFLIGKITEARQTGRPFYGECFGHQLAGIEYARSVLGIKDATSEEWGQGTYVVKKRSELKVGLHDGESFWSNYEVVINFENPPNFVTCQFHASYQSSLGNFHPLLVRFIDLCRNWTGNIGGRHL